MEGGGEQSEVRRDYLVDINIISTQVLCIHLILGLNSYSFSQVYITYVIGRG